MAQEAQEQDTAAVAPAPATTAPAAKDNLLKSGPRVAEKRQPDKELIYKHTPQGDLKLFLFLPPDWQPTDHRPAIICFFGGGWNTGLPQQFFAKADYFASRGLVAISADYRVRSRHEVTADKCVEDARSALRYLRQHAPEYGIDPEKLIASGGSAGGHLAACTALCPGPDGEGEDTSISCRPQALVLFNPVLDLSEEWVLKGTPNKLAISPMEFLEKVGQDCPPMIAFFGTNDANWLAQGLRFIDKSHHLGNRVELWMADGQPHGFFNGSPWHEATTIQADRFLADLGYLQGGPTMKPANDKATLQRRMPPVE